MLPALLIEIPYSGLSERKLVSQIDFNLLFRRTMGLSVDGQVLDSESFTRNRERLFAEGPPSSNR